MHRALNTVPTHNSQSFTFQGVNHFHSWTFSHHFQKLYTSEFPSSLTKPVQCHPLTVNIFKDFLKQEPYSLCSAQNSLKKNLVPDDIWRDSQNRQAVWSPIIEQGHLYLESGHLKVLKLHKLCLVNEIITNSARIPKAIFIIFLLLSRSFYHSLTPISNPILPQTPKVGSYCHASGMKKE